MTEAQWARIKDLLPPEKKAHGGRPGKSRRWTLAGVWENILSALIEQDFVDETTLMLDSTTIKVHQHVSGVKKGAITKKQGEAEAD